MRTPIHPPIHPTPYLPPTNPRLPNTTILLQDHKIRSLPFSKPSSLSSAHQRRNILRDGPRRRRNATPRPRNEIPHGVRNRAARANERIRALDGGHRPFLALGARDLGVAGVHAVGQAGQLDGVADEEGAVGRGAEQQRGHRRRHVHAVGQQREVRRRRHPVLPLPDQPRQPRRPLVQPAHRVERVREAGCARAQCCRALVECCGGVAQRDFDAEADEVLD